jgi:hypothetical protein
MGEAGPRERPAMPKHGEPRTSPASRSTGYRLVAPSSRIWWVEPALLRMEKRSHHEVGSQHGVHTARNG